MKKFAAMDEEDKRDIAKNAMFQMASLTPLPPAPVPHGAEQTGQYTRMCPICHEKGKLLVCLDKKRKFDALRNEKKSPNIRFLLTVYRLSKCVLL